VTDARDEEGESTYCFVPLRARGKLLGWVYMEGASCTAERQVVLRAIAGQLGPAIALLDVTGAHQEHLAQLQTLSDLGRSFSSELNLDTLLDTIYAGVRQLVDAQFFYIALYNTETGTMDLAYCMFDDERQAKTDSWNIYEGLTRVIVETRAPLCTHEYETECLRRGITPRRLQGLPPSRAWLGIPLFAHDHLLGLMNVSCMREGYSYTPAQVDLLVAIAGQAAIAIENARLYQRTERQARELATLNRIGRTLTSSLDPERVPSLIMEHVCDLLSVEEGSLLLADEQSGDLMFAYTSGYYGSQLLGQRIPSGVGIVGYVASSGKSLIVNDVRRDERFHSDTDQSTGYTTRAVLAVPLRSGGDMLGVIEVLNPRHGGTFTNNDKQLLEAVADQAVVALENARTFAQVDQALARRAQELAVTNHRLEHNLQSLTALNAVSIAMNTALRNPDDIFALTARGVVELTNARGASILFVTGMHMRSVVQVGMPPSLAELEPKVRAVIESGHPQAFLRALASGDSLFVVPLRAMQRTLGALCVYYGDELPDSSDQETIVLFATQAAGAVENTLLFGEVRDARDAMGSILASTRDGVMLIDANSQVELANAALVRLSGVACHEVEHASATQFLAAWQHMTSYEDNEWCQLRHGLSAVVSGTTSFEYGQLNALRANEPTLEWNVLKAEGSGGNQGGAVLVLRDITDAKAAEQLRDDLTNMIVHDLRSPLSSVMAAIELLQKDTPPHISPAHRNVLSIARHSSTQMLGMINTLLDISRLEDGRLPLDLAACDVGALVERAMEQLSSLAAERNVLVQTDLPASLPRIHADAELIVRVVQNLLGNALKFSGRGSTVLVRAWPVDSETRGTDMPEPNAAHAALPVSQVCIAVSDRGIGIDARHQEKIFAKFSQVSDRRGGSGLGLTFCKLVVEAHGGAIWVQSAIGEGSTFFFTLPVAADA
jgi:PAS domain S-box-containing protein